MAERQLSRQLTQINKIVDDSINSAMSRMEQKLDAAISREERCYALLLPHVRAVEKAQQRAAIREDFRIARCMTWSIICSVVVVAVMLYYIIEYKLFREVVRLMV
jgi:type VI protein secretion system component VasF